MNREACCAIAHRLPIVNSRWLQVPQKGRLLFGSEVVVAREMVGLICVRQMSMASSCRFAPAIIEMPACDEPCVGLIHAQIDLGWLM
jgi:hypothetical protein